VPLSLSAKFVCLATMAIVATRGKSVQVMRDCNTAVYVNRRDNADALPVCQC